MPKVSVQLQSVLNYNVFSLYKTLESTFPLRYRGPVVPLDEYIPGTTSEVITYQGHIFLAFDQKNKEGFTVVASDFSPQELAKALAYANDEITSSLIEALQSTALALPDKNSIQEIILQEQEQQRIKMACTLIADIGDDLYKKDWSGRTILFTTHLSLDKLYVYLSELKNKLTPSKFIEFINTEDRNKITALWIAAGNRTDGDERVRLLLEHGANPNSSTHTSNYHPIQKAFENSSWNIVDLLVRYEADLTVLTDRNETLLHTSCKHSLSCEKELKYWRLICTHKTINFQNDRGNTPMHEAVIARNSSAVEALLRAGADTTIYNHEKYTAKELAEKLASIKESSSDPRFWAMAERAKAVANVFIEYEQENLETNSTLNTPK